MRLETRKQKEKRKKRKYIKMQITLFLALALIIILLITSFVSRKNMSKQTAYYDQKIATLKKEIENEKNRQKQLEAMKEFTTTRAYIEQVARNKLGLVYPNEIVFSAEDR